MCEVGHGRSPYDPQGGGGSFCKASRLSTSDFSLSRSRGVKLLSRLRNTNMALRTLASMRPASGIWHSRHGVREQSGCANSLRSASELIRENQENDGRA